jgi:hypothetical protein
VLEIEKREGEKDLALSSQYSAQSGTPDSVRCARLAFGELATLGNVWRRTAIIHRTVRWANGRQRNGRPCNPRATRGPCQRSAGGTELARANCHGAAMVIYAKLGRRSAPDMLQWLSGGALDCLVHHTTEGNFGLPCWPPTTPSCLGAIKGTPMRMEE